MKQHLPPVLPLLAAAALLLGGCAAPPRDTLYQTSTIDALLAGVYDGDLACRDLLRHGDFGIGTFDRLEGEMIVLDGVVRQVRADGKVYRPDPATTTPFAAVCRFQPDVVREIDEPADEKAVEARLAQWAPNTNLFCAVRITGAFRSMKTRSVPAQSRPYRPLKEVTANQPVFEMADIRGTIVGFRCPPFVAGVNVPGSHLHFLSEDGTRGGHVLGYELARGRVELDSLHQFFLRLPEGSTDFATTDLTRDRSVELKAVER